MGGLRIADHVDIHAIIENVSGRLTGFNQQVISLSAGITVWDTNNESFNVAYKRADSLLYQSKEAGRARATIDADWQHKAFVDVQRMVGCN